MNSLFRGEAFDAVRNTRFRLFLTYRFLLTSGTMMLSVVVGWQLYQMTNDVLALGFIGLTEVIPQVSIALFAGHFVDLWDRKKIIFFTTFLLLFGSGILWVYSIPQLNLHAHLGTFPIYLTIFLTGLVRGILMPAHSAIMGQLVDRKLLTGAATWNSSVWQLAAVTGPAVGGLVYGYFGVVAAYSVVTTLFFLCLIILSQIKSPGRVVNPLTIQEGIFKRIGQGVGYVYRNKILLGAFSLDMFAVLFGGATAMLPVFAADILLVNPQGLGVLRACPAIGAIIMSIILTFRPPVTNSGSKLLWCVAGFGITMIVFAVSTNFYLSACCLILSGVFDNVSVIVRSSILQLYTTDEMKGRVSAVNSIFIGSSNELGAFESGLAARAMGLVPSVVFGGVMTLVVVGTAAYAAPTLRNLSLKEAALT